MQNVFKRILIDIIAQHQNQEVIRPEDMAANGLKQLDPDQTKRAAYLYLCQISREILRRSYEQDTNNRNQPPLPHLPLVQERYPQMPKSRGYVKLLSMLISDWCGNLRRLRGRSQRQAAHADQLEQWGIEHYGLKSKGEDHEERI